MSKTKVAHSVTDSVTHSVIDKVTLRNPHLEKSYLVGLFEVMKCNEMNENKVCFVKFEPISKFVNFDQFSATNISEPIRDMEKPMR